MSRGGGRSQPLNVAIGETCSACYRFSGRVKFDSTTFVSRTEKRQTRHGSGFVEFSLST
jgi:hypothetical protein